jgi:hypothetical protein
MRRSVLCVTLALLTALPLLASPKRLTNAEMDGFNSAVKSVSTKAGIASPQPRQPDGPVPPLSILSRARFANTIRTEMSTGEGKAGKPDSWGKPLAIIGTKTEPCASR